MTVYTPREDSFLLKNFIQELDLDGKKVLDIGTGTGLIAIEAAKKGAKVTAADINPEAIEYAREKARKTGVDGKIDFVKSNLFSDIEDRFDYILFNPPYLPGEPGVGDEEIWRGGEKGTELTQKFLEKASKQLSENGEILVIMSSHADSKQLKEKYDLEIVDSEKLWFETLYLARSK